VSDTEPDKSAPLPVRLTDAVLTGAVVSFGQLLAGAALVTRIAAKSEELLDETLELMRTVRPLIAKLDATLDVGGPAYDAAMPTQETLQATQEDIRVARETAEAMLSQVAAVVGQVEAIPGVGLVTGTVKGTLKTAGRIAKPRELPAE
jgi:hypothetical protein